MACRPPSRGTPRTPSGGARSSPPRDTSSTTNRTTPTGLLSLASSTYSGLWGPAAPLGPVVAPLVPRYAIGVGTVIAGRPLHRSRRAALPHRAPALRHDRKQRRHRRVDDAGTRYPSLNQAMHPIPPHRAFLAASRQRVVPQPAHFIAKPADGPPVAGHAVVLAMAAYHGGQILAYLGDRVVPALPQLSVYFPEFGPHAVTRSVPMHHELPFPRSPTAVDEAQELESFRLSLPALLSVLSGIPSKFQQARLVRVQRQAKLPEPLP